MIKKIFKCYRPIAFNDSDAEDDVTILDTSDPLKLMEIIDLTKDEDDEDVIIINTPEPKIPKKEHSPVNTPWSTPEPELVTPKKTAVDIQSFGFSPFQLFAKRFARIYRQTL